MSQKSIIPVAGYREPSQEEGFRSIQYDVDLVAALTFKVSLVDLVQKGNISRVVTMYFDNADNAFAITMVCNATQQRVIFAPNTQGYVRLLLANMPELLFSAPSPCIFPVNFLNFYVKETTWSSIAMGGPFVPLAGGTMTGPLIMANTTIVPDSTKGIVGTTLGDNAQAGSIGELISASVNSGAPVPIISGVPKDICSILLSPGDWDTNGIVGFAAAAGTVTSQALGWINDVSATVPSFPNNGAEFSFFTPNTAGAGVLNPTGTARYNITIPTIIYLTCLSIFTTSTSAGYGFIRARRIR